MNRIKKDDTVEVIAGEDRGRRGTVLRVLPKEQRVVVSKVNMITKHQRAVRAGRSQVQAGRIQYEAPIHLSNVMLVCPHCKAATRVGFEVTEDGSKVRVCHKCQAVID
ncbi:MAG: 50S ribosomal protein L24 [Chloroflexi bacterium]|nr:50S ribosomal protein L24 [Anaerolineae bacterium]NMC01209.1 50S ribosomal protein L24 [Chloroflexota bacterium]OQB03319.1 MAG: 50S ribosomal protein L24 [Chloroflexi bacterium ADurb.Bin222]HOC21030.1 50S ribosomal protein L24 [Anaerolineae bacterium]HOV47703.1 50S ribosomal protein L24 [Anaerolineae bacterium]